MTVMHKPEPLTATPTDWVVEDIPAGTFRVNRTALIDEAVFRDEMRSIFERCWLYVGHESEIPNAGRLPGPRRRQPAAGVLARPRRRQARLLQHLPASRGVGLPGARGQRPEP